MTRFVSFPLALTTALTLSLTACGGDDKETAAASTPSTAPSTPSKTPPSGPVARTTAELTKALLALSDLPPGFTEDKSDSSDGEKPFSSTSSGCKTLIKYLNATKAPGSTASVARSFAGGQEGPYIDFGLDAMGTVDKVAALQDEFEKAVDSCPKVTLKSEGLASTSMKVEKITAPQYGTKPFAFQLTGTSGPKRGLEATFATAGVDDVVVSVAVLAGQGELEAATEAAVGKAQKVLNA